MNGTYSIEIEPEIGFIRYTLAGFFDSVSLAALSEERLTKLRLLKRPGGLHVTLCDVSRCAIQSQETLAVLGAMFAQPEWPARRVAFVVGGALARMQVRRLVENVPNVEWFEDAASAEAWLKSA